MNIKKARRYNKWQAGRGHWGPDEFQRMIDVLGEERIVGLYQDYRNLTPVDGMVGPTTQARLHADSPPPFVRPGDIDETPRLGELADLEVDHEGVLVGQNVRVELAYPGWYYTRLLTESGQPEALYWHYTATNPGTARAMSKFRQQTVAQARSQRDEGWGPSSWTASIETDGTIWQMVSVFDGPWTIRPVKGLNWDNDPDTDTPPIAPNWRGMHFEIVSRNGVGITEAQVDACTRITMMAWRTFGIGPDEHYSHDELSRGTPFHHADPGPEFMNTHLPRIKADVYGDSL